MLPSTSRSALSVNDHRWAPVGCCLIGWELHGQLWPAVLGPLKLWEADIIGPRWPDGVSVSPLGLPLARSRLPIAGWSVVLPIRAVTEYRPCSQRWGGLSGRSISNRRNDGNYGPCASPLVARTEQAPPSRFSPSVSHSALSSLFPGPDLFLSSLLHPAIEFHPTQPTHFRIFSLLYNSTIHLLAPILSFVTTLFFFLPLSTVRSS